jgi:hypothetical protein
MSLNVKIERSRFGWAVDGTGPGWMLIGAVGLAIAGVAELVAKTISACA